MNSYDNLIAAFEKHWSETPADTKEVLDQAGMLLLARSVAMKLYFDGRLDVRTEFITNHSSRPSALATLGI